MATCVPEMNNRVICYQLAGLPTCLLSDGSVSFLDERRRIPSGVELISSSCCAVYFLLLLPFSLTSAPISPFSSCFVFLKCFLCFPEFLNSQVKRWYREDAVLSQPHSNERKHEKEAENMCAMRTRCHAIILFCLMRH